MSIKDRGKKYAEILDFLRKEYVAKNGKEASGLADTMLKRKAAEQVDELMKVVPFPETKITDWTKDRPTTGPKADVKTFPKEKKLTPETEGLGSFDKLKKELEEMEKLGQPYKDTSVSDFMSDYFDMPQKAPPKRNITELNNVKLYGDETFEELQIIKDTGQHPRNKANGGRIGFKFGTGKRSKNVKEIMDEVNKKLGTKTTGGEVKLSVDIPESPKAELQRMFDEFNQRFKKKTRSSKKEYERLKDEEPERMAEFDEMWEDPEKFVPNKNRLLTDDEIRDYEEVLGDSETWMTKGTLGEADEAIKRQIDYEKQMYAEYKVDKQSRKELEQAYNEIDFRMTGEDTKYEANELADMLAETRYKTEFYDLPQKTQIDLYGEAYDYLMEVKRDRANFKGAIDTTTGKNIVTKEQELPIDPMTGKPRKLNAKGGLNYLMGM